MRTALLIVRFLAACLIPGSCFTEEECENTEKYSSCTQFERYRSYSGRCNNLNIPEQGAAKSVQQRFLPPDYDDTCIHSPRAKGVSGSVLPNPRKVSQTVHTSTQELDSELTLMVMQWGQFIDHDLSLTPHVIDTANECDSCESQNLNISSCFPIKIPTSDSFFTESTCFEFTRSLPNKGATREQTNDQTSYMDASMVYGSSRCLLEKLREAGDNSHRMRVSTSSSSSKSLLPTLKDEIIIQAECSNSLSGKCFLAGDIRVNIQPGLTSMHTVMVREHNRIADKLKQINVNWGPNKIFEETRRIIAAQIQHITYNEYLPRVLGPYGLGNFDLDLLTYGYYSEYNSSCSATTFNEFSTAAFRFGHSMIPSKLPLISKEDEEGNIVKENSPLRNHFMNPDIVSSGRLDDLLRGFTRTAMLPTDRHVTEEVTNHLFESRDEPKSGMDLPALNIQRGRDHGLPGYNKYRQICNLPKATEFTDLSNEMSEENIKKLRLVYDHPDDIDLHTGLLSEIPLPGAITGPTLTCIIGQQFKNIRNCDRYWYETSNPEIKFSERQLQEIRSSSLAALICKNMDENSKIARSPMDLVNSWTNPLVDCEQDIKSIDLEAWREDCVQCINGCTAKIENKDNRFYRFNGNFYYFETDSNKYTWQEAHLQCTTMFASSICTAHLASFQTLEEYNFIRQKMTSLGITWILLGGKRSTTNNLDWEWTDGTPMNRTLVPSLSPRTPKQVNSLWVAYEPMNDKAMMILTHIGTHIDGLNDIPDTYPVNSFVCKIPCTGC